MTSRSSRIRRRIGEYSRRDLLIVVLPLLAILIAGFWGASRFIQPAPPGKLVLSSGGEGGAYQRFAAAYADFLGRYGVRLEEKPSAGSIENLARLRDDSFEVDAAFFQGGTGEAREDEELRSLGAFFYEPLWVFYRSALAPASGKLDQVLQLVGRSRSHRWPERGVGDVVEPGTSVSNEMFDKGDIDAAFVVGPTQSATVWSLLYTEGVRLMSLAQADAYTRQLPYLAKIVLPRGAVDLGRDLPSADVTLVASVATLLVREDTHPALVDLLMQAAGEAHGGAGVFQKPGEFPRATADAFALSKEAERYYKSGKPFLQRYLPFWAATLIDRLVVMAIPVFALLVPIVKFAPALYGWRVRSRIYRRYGELKFLEAEVEDNPTPEQRQAWLARLDAIERDVNHIPTPLAFSDMLYTLRAHIGLVRAAIVNRPTTGA